MTVTSRLPEQDAIALVKNVLDWRLPERDYTADQVRGRKLLRHVEQYLSARIYSLTGGTFHSYKGVRV